MSDVDNTKKRNRVSGWDCKKKRAVKAEIIKKSVLMFKFLNSKQANVNTLLLKTNDSACIMMVSKNCTTEYNVTHKNYNTIKYRVIYDNVESEDTDFNSENDNPESHLNLGVDIKNSAKWPVIEDKIKLLLVNSNSNKINLDYYPLDDYSNK